MFEPGGTQPGEAEGLIREKERDTVGRRRGTHSREKEGETVVRRKGTQS